MMPNITRGSRTRGLLGYLYGPGKSDEHTNPHIVAGYEQVALLEPGRLDDGSADPQGLNALAGLLDLSMRKQVTPSPRHVWQCSLSLASDEGELGDAKWGRIATRFVEKMGLGDCQWIAVHHGLSKGGNDHVHLLVVLANSDGSKPRMHQDAKRSQQVADALEDEFGLIKRTPGRSGDRTGRKAPGRNEVSRADREQRPLAREALRRKVRAALAGAGTEADWLANLAAAGVSVKPFPDDGGPVTGYSASMDVADPDEEPIWFAGATLDGALSLPRVRERWPEQEPLTGEAWAEAAEAGAGRTVREPNAADRATMWGAAARGLGEQARVLKGLDADDPQWPPAAQACADVLNQVAAIAEPDRADGAVSTAADLVARAVAPPRTRREVRERDWLLARTIGAVGAQLRAAGPARRSGDTPLVLAVVAAAAQIAVVVALWRQAQADRPGFNVAATAATGLRQVVADAGNAGTLPAEPQRAVVPVPRRGRDSPSAETTRSDVEQDR